MKNIKTKAQNIAGRIKWSVLFFTGNLNSMYAQSNHPSQQNNLDGIWINILGVLFVILFPILLKGTLEGINFFYEMIKQTIYELLGILEHNSDTIIK